MSETAVTPSNPAPPTDDVFLDGDAPRLDSSPMIAPAPLGATGTPTLETQTPAAPSLPLVSPVLSSAAPTAPPAHTTAQLDVAAVPTLPGPAPVPQPVDDRRSSQPVNPSGEFALPTLPDAAAHVPKPAEDQPTLDGEFVDGAESESAHPMAHMMPSKSKPSAAAARAAEVRAARKAKSRKIKIAVGIGALVVSALVGPPLVSWLTNAINEAGSVTTEEPAP